MCKTTKPAVCEVDGCSGTHKIARHKATGLFACLACRERYRYNNGTFAYHTSKPKPTTCIVCNHEVAPAKMRRNGICVQCQTYYKRNGTYTRKIHKRRLTEREQTKTCQRCNTRESTSYAGARWLCSRCARYYHDHGKHRPMHYDTDVCRTCARPLIRLYSGNHGGKGYCKVCRTYMHRHGRERPKDLVQAQAPNGWCECGKPATQQVDLRTGGILVVPTKTGTADYLTETREEYTEWMCDECAGYEAEMAQVGGNEPRPGALIARA